MHSLRQLPILGLLLFFSLSLISEPASAQPPDRPGNNNAAQRDRGNPGRGINANRRPEDPNRQRGQERAERNRARAEILSDGNRGGRAEDEELPQSVLQRREEMRQRRQEERDDVIDQRQDALERREEARGRSDEARDEAGERTDEARVEAEDLRSEALEEEAQVRERSAEARREAEERQAEARERAQEARLEAAERAQEARERAEAEIEDPDDDPDR